MLCVSSISYSCLYIIMLYISDLDYVVPVIFLDCFHEAVTVVTVWRNILCFNIHTTFEQNSNTAMVSIV